MQRAPTAPVPELRDLAIAKMQQLPAGSTPRDIVRLVRPVADAVLH